MKTFIASGVVAIFMLCGFFVYINYLDKTTDELSYMIEEISFYAEENSWEKCSDITNLFVKKWEDNEKILCSFTDHGDLDEIKRGICELKESVKYKDVKKTTSNSAILLVLFERLTENEMPTPENILRINTQNTSFA